MKQSTAIKLRKFLPKSYIEKVERFMISYGQVCFDYEDGKLTEQEVHSELLELSKYAIEQKIHLGEIQKFVMQPDAREIVDYLKDKWGM